MRLDHLLSKEEAEEYNIKGIQTQRIRKEKSIQVEVSVEGSILFNFEWLMKLRRWKKGVSQVNRYGLIAQLVRAHA